MQVNYFKFKQILFFLAILCCSKVYSQKDTSKFKPHSELGVCLSPYENCNIKPKSGYNHEYSNKFIFIIGLNPRFILSNRSSITTGINFYNFIYKVNYVWIVNQNGDPNIPLSAKIRGTYIDIPLQYSFKFIVKEKISFHASAGASYLVLNGIKDNTTFANNITRNSDYANKSLLSYQFGLGFEYKKSNKNILRIEPYFRIFDKGFDKLMNQNLTSFGIKITNSGKIKWRCFFRKAAWQPWPTCD